MSACRNFLLSLTNRLIQLAYFSYAKQHFAGLWAGPEVFLHGVSKLIVDIDWTRGLFEWVDMPTVLMHLSLLPEQVLKHILACSCAAASSFYEYSPSGNFSLSMLASSPASI